CDPLLTQDDSFLFPGRFSNRSLLGGLLSIYFLVRDFAKHHLCAAGIRIVACDAQHFPVVAFRTVAHEEHRSRRLRADKGSWPSLITEYSSDIEFGNQVLRNGVRLSAIP